MHRTPDSAPSSSAPTSSGAGIPWPWTAVSADASRVTSPSAHSSRGQRRSTRSCSPVGDSTVIRSMCAVSPPSKGVTELTRARGCTRWATQWRVSRSGGRYSRGTRRVWHPASREPGLQFESGVVAGHRLRGSSPIADPVLVTLRVTIAHRHCAHTRNDARWSTVSSPRSAGRLRQTARSSRASYASPTCRASGAGRLARCGRYRGLPPCRRPTVH